MHACKAKDMCVFPSAFLLHVWCVMVCVCVWGEECAAACLGCVLGVCLGASQPGGPIKGPGSPAGRLEEGLARVVQTELQIWMHACRGRSKVGVVQLFDVVGAGVLAVH